MLLISIGTITGAAASAIMNLAPYLVILLQPVPEKPVSALNSVMCLRTSVLHGVNHTMQSSALAIAHEMCTLTNLQLLHSYSKFHKSILFSFLSIKQIQI